MMRDAVDVGLREVEAFVKWVRAGRTPGVTGAFERSWVALGSQRM
ncbi:hypothetical protein ENSA7_63900 [Enhygromyxa salina]|uniref:Uncharacterized protein n=1 Tax=Enhygromyxa salina TaxID=215803 RepID=A0A2S9Y2L9_9BACT|nr:hypothetical protein ENSA7_63900 [Enhygromyxa salina]